MKLSNVAPGTFIVGSYFATFDNLLFIIPISVLQPFTELMEDYNDALATSGISVSGRLAKLQRYSVITHRHEALGKDKLDDTVLADYVREIGDRYNAGEIGSGRANDRFYIIYSDKRILS